MDEIWKPVEKYPYEVSNLGRVRRSKSAIVSKGTSVGRILNPSPNKITGYVRIKLFREGEVGKFIRASVHRLVAEAFLGPCPEGKEVNHCDGNKAHNHADNLEYISHQDNLKHHRCL